MIAYAEDTAAWEEWQRDYRLGLILILPPPEVARVFDRLRQKYDPRSHAVCPAHISVSDPLRLEMTDKRREEIRALCAGIEPFPLRYGPPRASTERAGVSCPVGPQAAIDRLKDALHGATVFDGQVYRRRSVPAHMTIAEFVSIEESAGIRAAVEQEVGGGAFVCQQLDFIVPDEGFCFRKVMRFRLGKQALDIDAGGGL